MAQVGRFCQGIPDSHKAESYLVDVVRRDGISPAWRALADLYYTSGRRDQALAAYRRVAAGQADGATLLLLQERIAICQFAKRYDSVPRSYRLLEAGVAAEKRKDRDAARCSFEEAIRSDPTNVVAHNNLGSLLLNAGEDANEALACFERAAQFWESPVLEANLTRCRFEIHRKGRANPSSGTPPR